MLCSFAIFALSSIKLTPSLLNGCFLSSTTDVYLRFESRPDGKRVAFNSRAPAWGEELLVPGNDTIDARSVRLCCHPVPFDTPVLKLPVPSDGFCAFYDVPIPSRLLARSLKMTLLGLGFAAAGIDTSGDAKAAAAALPAPAAAAAVAAGAAASSAATGVAEKVC
jgi:hypothetical protein